MATAFAQFENIVPLLVPQDIAGTATASAYMGLKTAQRATIALYFGGITTASADQTAGPVVTLEAATSAASSAAETACAFNYRLSSATGTNTWGAVTAATATGVDLTVTGDGKILLIDVDPAAIAAALDDATHVRVVITPGTGGATCLVGVIGFVDPRYKQTTMVAAC